MACIMATPAGLGIGRAPSVHEAVADVRLEGRDRHDLDGGRVHVTLEEHGPVRVLPLEGGHEVVPARQRLGQLDGEPDALEEGGEVLHHARLTVPPPGQRGVHALDGHHVLQGGEDLVLATVPGTCHSVSLLRVALAAISLLLTTAGQETSPNAYGIARSGCRAAFHDYRGSYTSDMTTYQRFLRRVSDLVPWQRSQVPNFSISFPSPATDPWVYEVSLYDGSGRVRWLGEQETGIYAVLSLDDRSGQPQQNHARFKALKAKAVSHPVRVAGRLASFCGASCARRRMAGLSASVARYI